MIPPEKPSDRKYFGIRRVYIEIFIAIVVCILAIALMSGEALAADIDTNHSYIIVGNETNSSFITSNVSVISNQTANVTNATSALPGPKEFADRRIDQGSCVQVGETIDIAGIGWYSGVIAYYGRYYDAYPGGGNLSMKAVYEVKSTDLNHFYVGPYFADHYGYWYGYDPFTDTKIESHANDRLFHVEPSCNMTQRENATAVSEAFNESKARAAIRANLSKLSEKTKPGIDLILGKNTSVPYSPPYYGARAWIFGDGGDDTYYDIGTTNGSLFTKGMLDHLSPGDYDVIFVSPGNNTLMEEIYDSHEKNIYSPLRSTPNATVLGAVPAAVEKTLIKRIGSTDDKYTKIRITVEDPSIEIRKLDRADLLNNQSMIILSGYTNSAVGDSITVQIDPEKINGITKYYSTWKTVVVDNGGNGAYRTWNASLIIDFNNVFPGPHTLTVTSGSGGSASVPIYARNELAGHYVPPERIEYFDNSPFIPPVFINTTVTVVVPGPVQTVIQNIPPSQKEINDAGTAVATVWYVVSVIIVALLYFAYRFGRWMLSIYRRTQVMMHP